MLSTLILFVTFVALDVLIIILIINLIKNKPVKPVLRKILVVFVSYSVLWLLFYFKSSEHIVLPGTDICFDDWCASVTKIDKPDSLGNSSDVKLPHGKFILLHIRVSNHAKRIAQTPSEPRIFIMDSKGMKYFISDESQQSLEQEIGKQPDIGERLELHQTVETQLAFDVPRDATGLKIRIEEHPAFITKILFPEDRDIFLVE